MYKCYNKIKNKFYVLVNFSFNNEIKTFFIERIKYYESFLLLMKLKLIC